MAGTKVERGGIAGAPVGPVLVWLEGCEGRVAFTKAEDDEVEDGGGRAGGARALGE